MTGVDVETNSHREMINAMRSLETMVDQKGGINSVQHIADLIRWMSDAEGFDVRIVYVCVVNATESRDILSQFIQEGGWNCLAKWLEYFMASNKHAAIRELLLCFQKLPIEAKTLSVQVDSKELPGKMIRSLRKHHDDEIKQIATAVYMTWKNLDEQEREKRAKKREKKTKEEIKPKKQKTSAAISPSVEPKKPTLTDSFMDNVFLSEEQKKKAIEDKKKAKAKKKEEKKKKEEAKKTPIQFNEHLSFLNDIGKVQSATETGELVNSGEHHSKFENLGNRSPPMHLHGDNNLNGIKGSPPHKNDIQPRKEPKPGAKLVRWTDSVNRPLEQVREFEIVPNERVNVNNRDYKIMMETEAFKEENNGTAPSLGDLAPKRQWRSPKHALSYFSQQIQKNLESSSKDSTEKTQAAEKTARTLQQIYLKAQIPFTPTEPDHSTQAPVGDIPRIPLVMKDSQEKQPEPATAAVAPAQPVPNINFDLLNQIVQTTNSNSKHGSSSSRSPSGGPAPPQRNPYDSMAPPPSYNGSAYRGSSPLINDQREFGYRRDYYSRGPTPPHQQQQQQQPGYDRGYQQRRSRSPPTGQRSSSNEPYHRNEPYRRPESGYHNRGYARR